MGRELLPAAPLQPCAEAPLGRGHIVTLLDWVNLAPGHYASNYARLAIQASEAPPRLVAEAPHPVVHTGGGYYPRLASTFPAPRLRPSCVYCLLLRSKALIMMSNEQTACFPMDKWRFDKTDPTVLLLCQRS